MSGSKKSGCEMFWSKKSWWEKSGREMLWYKTSRCGQHPSQKSPGAECPRPKRLVPECRGAKRPGTNVGSETSWSKKSLGGMSRSETYRSKKSGSKTSWVRNVQVLKVWERTCRSKRQGAKCPGT